ncbi:hypothetical protein M2322_000404 [Rhodoblastus acidophilus]|uniref:hypothetical protein n=1 Tax=Rhodoblastus acidophilus TaxID=1074 RepID=UPI00222411DA|nr:hypothetical protein [Rhodoblastus acidophilus]MCW2314884.1 hypothetical protein [Rhodoblastus acidophilus]
MKSEVFRLACEFSYGAPLIDNSFRGVVAEAIVRLALSPDWKWCSTGWAGWDFEHQDGTRLEIKQSAARQPWTISSARCLSRSFDIRARSGHYVGSEWKEDFGRKAAIYVFANHLRVDEEADHRDPDQWEFYLLPTTELPDQKTISLSVLKRLAAPVAFQNLSVAVESLRSATCGRNNAGLCNAAGGD